MRKKLHKFEKFKLLLEKSNDRKKKKDKDNEDSGDSGGDDFDFDNFNLDTDDDGDNNEENNDDFIDDNNDSGDNGDFNFDDTSDGGDNEDGGEETEEETEEDIDPKDRVFNEDPSYYVEQALKKVERKLISLFDEPTTDEKGRTNTDTASYHNQGVELVDIKTTGMPMNKTLILKYHDNDFSYQLLITVDTKQGIPEKSDIEMNYDMVEFGGVKFKKYDVSNNLLGELDRKKVSLNSIDQDFIDKLNGELDSKYSIDNNFKIEYNEDSGADNE